MYCEVLFVKYNDAHTQTHTHRDTPTPETFCPCVCAPQNEGKKRLCVVKRGREGEKGGFRCNGGWIDMSKTFYFVVDFVLLGRIV
jgi:hypothetical protein